MNLLQTLIYGLIGGLSDILPISSQAHSRLITFLYGQDSAPNLLRLIVRMGIIAGLYYNCHTHILKILRAYKLSRVPKRRRRRPLDMSSVMDLRLMETMLLPLIFGFLFYRRISALVSILSVWAAVVLANGVILYIPQFLPGSNKSSLHITPADGLLMGLGATVSLIPGISCVGTVCSVGAVRGVDRTYALNMALLLNMLVNVGLAIYDVIAIIGQGISGFGLSLLVTCLASGVAAFGGTLLGIVIMKKLAASRGFGVFAYYCWGIAMLLFILFLTV